MHLNLSKDVGNFHNSVKTSIKGSLNFLNRSVIGTSAKAEDAQQDSSVALDDSVAGLELMRIVMTYYWRRSPRDFFVSHHSTQFPVNIT